MTVTAITEAERLREARARVVSIVEMLGLDEVGVLEVVAQGLARGRSQYGELHIDTDARDFTAEAAAELRDTLVYVGAELLRIDRRTARSNGTKAG